MVWTSDDDGQSPRAIAQQLRLARRQAPIRQQEEDDDSGSQQLRIVQHQSIFSDDDDDDMTPIEVTRRLQIIRRQAPIRNDDDMQLEALSAPQYPGEWPQPQIHLVVDSNALIDHVDWIMAVKDVLVMSGVVFAICSVVINELDRLKCRVLLEG
uniref:PIN domain-containing protein n=1 Tax=Spongospora subterranea TaxID=70186 RepID=A0A0H5QVG3_9EUKA|eukprot:CRZ05978.1 hypothetical protein [Spongospora subterranea]